MKEALDRLREPAAWAAIAVMAVTVLLALLGMVVPSMARFPVLPASGGVGAGAVLFAAIAWCASGRTAHARVLTLAGAMVLGVAVVIDAVQLAVIIADEKTLSLNYALAWVVEMLFTAAMVVGLAVVGMAGVGRAPDRDAEPVGAPPPTQVPASPAVASSTPGSAPVWRPEEAAARSWSRAGDAATGATATQWGSAPSAPVGAPTWGGDQANPWALQPDRAPDHHSPLANRWPGLGDRSPRAD